MAYREITGNLFASKAQALVNTVNCVGPMGKGIALEFRRRFPEMFEVYKTVCERRQLHPGQILPYRKTKPWVLNFAVKNDWKHPSKIQWVDECLRKFIEWYPTVGLRSVAFPWMGAMNGGIPLEQIKEITRRHLEPLTDIDVEVYSFDSTAPDPLFSCLKGYLSTHSSAELAHDSGLVRSKASKICESASRPTTTSLTILAAQSGLGKTSLDRFYAFLNGLSEHDADFRNSPPLQEQLELFP